MELLSIVYFWTIFAKSSFLDVFQGSEYASDNNIFC